MSRRIRRFPPQMDSDGADVTGDLIEMETLEQRYLGLVARIRQYPMPDAARARVLAEVEPTAPRV